MVCDVILICHNDYDELLNEFLILILILILTVL